jgi:mono/diheme cytochrome c family protein
MQRPALALLLLLLSAAPGAAAPDGAWLYARHCAGCHGADLRGQPDWNRPNARGRLPAPPLDGSGHAWQHSDAALEGMVARSMADTAPPGYRTDMPAFAGRLSPAEIRAVVRFIKSRWPLGTRISQAMLNPDGAAELARLLREAGPDAEWRFPGECIPPGGLPASRPTR